MNATDPRLARNHQAQCDRAEYLRCLDRWQREDAVLAQLTAEQLDKGKRAVLAAKEPGIRELLAPIVVCKSRTLSAAVTAWAITNGLAAEPEQVSDESRTSLARSGLF